VNIAEQKFLAVWLARAAMRRSTDFSKARDKVYAEQQLKGIRHSGRTIELVVEAASTISETFAKDAVAEIERLKSPLELLPMAQSAVLTFMDGWIAQLPELVLDSHGGLGALRAINAIAEITRSDLEMFFDETRLKFIALSVGTDPDSTEENQTQAAESETVANRLPEQNHPLVSKRRGPKPKVDKVAFQEKVFALLENEGVPDPTIDPAFRQSDIEREMMAWHGDAIAESRNRELVSAAITSFIDYRSTGKGHQ
jgi:hypothetical protein